MASRRRVAALATLAGCFLDTTRPPFEPFPEAPRAEVKLERQAATQRLADALRADSIPLRRVELRDGYLETQWLDAATLRPASRRAVGPEVVRVRGWVDPGRVGYSDLTLESVYRLLLDPSLPERELERSVPPGHPVATRVQAVLEELARRYGGAPLTPAPPDTTRPPPAPPPPPPSPERGDTGR
jgi:hypothetical protein